MQQIPVAVRGENAALHIDGLLALLVCCDTSTCRSILGFARKRAGNGLINVDFEHGLGGYEWCGLRLILTEDSEDSEESEVVGDVERSIWSIMSNT